MTPEQKEFELNRLRSQYKQCVELGMSDSAWLYRKEFILLRDKDIVGQPDWSEFEGVK